MFSQLLIYALILSATVHFDPLLNYVLFQSTYSCRVRLAFLTLQVTQMQFQSTHSYRVRPYFIRRL